MENKQTVETDDRWAERPMFASDADVTVYWPDVRPCYNHAAMDCPPEGRS